VRDLFKRRSGFRPDLRIDRAPVHRAIAGIWFPRSFQSTMLFSLILVPSPISNLAPLLQSQPNASKIEAWKRNRYLALWPNSLLRLSLMRLSA
jgi:hypothetical protein